MDEVLPLIHLKVSALIPYKQATVEKKEEIRLSPITKAKNNHRKAMKSNATTQNAKKRFDCSTITERLRTVNLSQPDLRAQTSHSPQRICNRKDIHL